MSDLFHADLNQLFEALHPFFKTGLQLFTSRLGPIHTRFGFLKSHVALLKVTLKKRFYALESLLNLTFHYEFQSNMAVRPDDLIAYDKT